MSRPAWNRCAGQTMDASMIPYGANDQKAVMQVVENSTVLREGL